MTSLETIPEEEVVEAFPSDHVSISAGALQPPWAAYSPGAQLLTVPLSLSRQHISQSVRPSPSSVPITSPRRVSEATWGLLIAAIAMGCIIFSIAPSIGIWLCLLSVPTSFVFWKWGSATDDDSFNDMLWSYAKGFVPAGIIVGLMQIFVIFSLAWAIIPNHLLMTVARALPRGQVSLPSIIEQLNRVSHPSESSQIAVFSYVTTGVLCIIHVIALYALARNILESNENYFHPISTAWGSATAGLGLASMLAILLMISEVLLSSLEGNGESSNFWNAATSVCICVALRVPFVAMEGYAIGLIVAQSQFYRLRLSPFRVLWFPLAIEIIIESSHASFSLLWHNKYGYYPIWVVIGLLGLLVMYAFIRRLFANTIVYEKRMMLLINEC